MPAPSSPAPTLLEQPAPVAPAGGPPPVGRRRRGRVAAAGALAIAAAAGGWLLLGGGSTEPERERTSGGATARVTRETLVAREDVEGTLGYSGKRTLIHRTSEPPTDRGSDPVGGSVTLTGVARGGSVVRRGGVLYRANGEPVFLMYGAAPAYRTLKAGVEDGDDVRRLEANLVALGFGASSVTVDEEFTDATAEAVRDWQDALGLQETGAVELGRVIFLPGPRRVGAAQTPVGSPLADGAEVLDTTSTRKVVEVELEAIDQSLAREGARVTVTLPDGRLLNGRITSVGRVAREQDSDSGGDPAADSGTGTLVIDVRIKLAKGGRTGRLDEAPVTVGLARETRRRVLAVPVTALLARPGGGYAVEVVPSGGGRRRTVPVRTGLFASGLVEIEGGKRISEGMRVAVPE